MGPPHDELLSAQRRRTSIGSGSASERSHRPGALGIVADFFRRVSGTDESCVQFVLCSMSDATWPFAHGEAHEVAGVRWAPGRCGCVAARDACAADNKAADDWVPWRGHGVDLGTVDGCLPAPTAGTRLDRGAFRCDRVSLGGGTEYAICGNRN